MMDAVVTRLPEDEHRIQLRRAIVASTVGIAIEWYDFFLYSICHRACVCRALLPPIRIRWWARSRPSLSKPSAWLRGRWAQPSSAMMTALTVNDDTPSPPTYLFSSPLPDDG